jgi:hypothetical protein
LSPWQRLFTTSSPQITAMPPCPQHTSLSEETSVPHPRRRRSCKRSTTLFPYLVLVRRNHGRPVPAIHLQCARRRLQLQPQGCDHSQSPAHCTAQEEAGWPVSQLQQAPRQLLDPTVWQHERQADEQENQDLCQRRTLDTACSPGMHSVGRRGGATVRHLHSGRSGYGRLYHADTSMRLRYRSENIANYHSLVLTWLSACMPSTTLSTTPNRDRQPPRPATTSSPSSPMPASYRSTSSQCCCHAATPTWILQRLDAGAPCSQQMRKRPRSS